MVPPHVKIYRGNSPIMNIFNAILSVDNAYMTKIGSTIPEDVLRIMCTYIKTNHYNYKIEKLFHINNIKLQDYIHGFYTYNVKTLKQIKKDDNITWQVEGTGGTGGYVKVDYVDCIAIHNYENELRKRLNELKEDNICLKYYRKNKPIGKKYYEKEDFDKAIDINHNNKMTHQEQLDIQFQELYKQYVIDNPNANLPAMDAKYTKYNKITKFTDFYKSKLLNKTIYSYKMTGRNYNYKNSIMYYNGDNTGTYDPRYENAGGAKITLM